MLYNFNEEDIDVLENELGYSRCLVWDNKLSGENDYKNYCNGKCDICSDKLTMTKFLESKKVNLDDVGGFNLILVETLYRYHSGRPSRRISNYFVTTGSQTSKDWLDAWCEDKKEKGDFSYVEVLNIIPLNNVKQLSQHEDGYHVTISYKYKDYIGEVRFNDYKRGSFDARCYRLDEKEIKEWVASMKDKHDYRDLIITDIKPIGI